MDAAWLYLAVTAVGALFTLNAYRPTRFPLAIVPAFFASWLTSELAAHHLVWQVAATAAFVWVGALEAWPGWLGLGIALVSWTGLVGLLRRGARAGNEVEHALREGFGDGYRSEIDPHRGRNHSAGISRYRLAAPFAFRHRDVIRVRNIEYGPHGRRNNLDVWHHRDQPAEAPVLVWVHGGAWIIGHKYQQGLPMLGHLASRGWVCVAINYRLSPRATFPDHIVDVKRALAWTREHIAGFGGDPGFLVISGASAGGHLSSLAALTPGDPEYQPDFEDADTSVQACVPFYGVYDFTNRLGSRPGLEGVGFRQFIERRVLKVSPTEDPETWQRASPLDRVHAGAPPFFVIHGTHDVLAPVADARAFVERLREVSREPVAYAELSGAQHAFDIFHSVRTAHVILGVERFGDWCWTRDRAGARAEGTGSVNTR